MDVEIAKLSVRAKRETAPTNGTEAQAFQHQLTGDSVALWRILEVIADAIFIIGPAGRILLANQSAIDLFGYTREELLGQPVEVLIPESARKGHQAHRKAYAKDPAFRPMGADLDLKGLRKDGSQFPLDIQLSPLEMALGSAVVVTIRDITLRRKAQQTMMENEQRLRAVVDNFPCEIHLKDTEQRYLMVNRAFERTFDVRSEDVLGKKPVEVLSPEMASICRVHDQQILNGVARVFQEDERHDQDGIRTLLTTKFPILDSEGKVSGIGGIAQDISERKRFERALRQGERRYHDLYDNLPDIYFLVNLDGRVSAINRYGVEALKLSMPEVVGRQIWDLVCNSDRADFKVAINGVHRGIETVLEQKFRYRGIEGKKRWMHARIWLPVHGEQSLHVVWRDITEAQELAHELEHQASHDGLTGLVNRREFEVRLGRALKSVGNARPGHALCYLDLDQFKVINDTCGHLAGDEMLQVVGQLLDARLRQRDTLARLGGDEFGILMEHCSLDRAYEVMDEIRHLIEEHSFEWQGNAFRLGISIGVVPLTDETDSVAAAMSAADSACYSAKEAGRHRIQVYGARDAELIQRQEEMEWVARINRALDDDRLELYYQAIVPVDWSEPDEVADEGAHYELLVRMTLGNGDVAPPGLFLPAAERYHLIGRIDRRVLTKALDWLVAHPQLWSGIAQIGANLSGQSLGDPRFLEFAVERIKASGIPAEKLCFEITETAAIANLEHANRFIAQMKALGCCFALDDFGSGLSSFAYLKTLPVDYLKIDGLFVKDIVDDPINYALVSSINDIGQVMGKKTIAEFVENQEILDKLLEVGVDYAQGYHLGRPQPLDGLGQGGNKKGA